MKAPIAARVDISRTGAYGTAPSLVSGPSGTRRKQLNPIGVTAGDGAPPGLTVVRSA